MWDKWRVEILKSLTSAHNKADSIRTQLDAFSICANPHCGVLFERSCDNYVPISIYSVSPCSDCFIAKEYCNQCRPAEAERRKAEEWAKQHPNQAKECMQKHQEKEKSK